MAKRKTTKKTPEPEVKMIFLPTFFIGMFVCAASIFLLLSFLTSDITLDPQAAAKICVTGLFGAWAAYSVIITLGTPGAYLFAGLFFCWGAKIMKRNRIFATWPAVLGGTIMIGSFALFCGVFSSAENIMQGGLLSSELLTPAKMYFGGAGVAMASVVLFLIGLVMAFGAQVFTIGEVIFGITVDKVKAISILIGKIVAGVASHLRPKIAEAVVTAGQGALVPVKRAVREYKQIAVTSEQEKEEKRRQKEEEERARREREEREELERLRREEEERLARQAQEEAQVAAEEDAESDSEDEEAELEVAAAVVNEDDLFAAGQALDDEGMSGFVPVTEAINFDELEDDDENLSQISATFEDEIDDLDDEDEAFVNPYEKLASTPPKPQPVMEEEEEEIPTPAPVVKEEPYVLPPLGMLDPTPPHKGGNPAMLEKRAKILETTLSEFRIQGQVVHIERGPRITQFEVSLAPGIKLSRVSGLADNISMALKAPSVRIIAPIPGKDTIGIEIPNIDQELVGLREIVDAVSREKRKQMLPLCLAKDVAGKPVIADLAKMPHLLIAGSTGSGKSVCINSIIMSFLCCLKPEECKLIMVDPKVVELSRFKHIPHLMSPVITDMQRAVGVLEWACQEMDQRYEKLSMVSVNNLAKFNALSEEDIEKRVGSVYGEEELAVFPRKLPCIVIIIDELADLMMVAKKEVENHIARLAAKSRAVGIHLILATQRPSTDVITGLIKANMPSRIAFQVASKIDSRIILDQMGADSLLGQGDMLYLPPGASKIQRAQGVFVSDEELFKVVDFCKAQRLPEYHTDLEGPVIGNGSKDNFDLSDYDELFLESARQIIESGRGSVSLLQRKLGIGYGRASRIIDQLAEAGILGQFREGKAREIMMDMEEYESTFFGGVFDSRAKSSGSQPQMAGVRDDEKGPANIPWD